MHDRDRMNCEECLESVKKIIRYSRDFLSADELFANEIVYDAILLNFINIGESVIRLSSEFLETNTAIDWHKIRGLRNVIAHDYFGVDAEEIWQIIKHDIPHLQNELISLL
jgi:uncharacterized protein with HEPN domain